MHIKTPSTELLQRYLTDNCSAKERKLVDDWYKTLQLPSEEQFTDEDQKFLFKRIENQIATIKPAVRTMPNPFGKWRIYASGMAAMLLLSLGLLYYTTQRNGQQALNVSELPVIMINTQKKIVKYELPDSSMVWLQPGATIEHPKTFGANANREVNFSGEAFFEIAKNPDQPFMIRSGKLKTMVLGTSFNIKANHNDSNYQVSVVTGTVSVSASDGENDTRSILLKPQQQATFSTTTNDLTFHNMENKKTDKEPWQPVSLTFDDAPLSDIISDLQKTFSVEIFLANPAMNNCVLKVDFNNQNLPEILEILNTLMVSTYEIEGRSIILMGEGCTGN